MQARQDRQTLHCKSTRDGIRTMDDFRAWLHAEALDRGAKQKLNSSGKCGTYNFCRMSILLILCSEAWSSLPWSLQIVLEGSEDEANFKKGPVGWGGNQYFLYCADCTGSILRCLDALQWVCHFADGSFPFFACLSWELALHSCTFYFVQGTCWTKALEILRSLSQVVSVGQFHCVSRQHEQVSWKRSVWGLPPRIAGNLAWKRWTLSGSPRPPRSLFGLFWKGKSSTLDKQAMKANTFSTSTSRTMSSWRLVNPKTVFEDNCILGLHKHITNREI